MSTALRSAVIAATPDRSNGRSSLGERAAQA
jgi:hypothetical protein